MSLKWKKLLRIGLVHVTIYITLYLYASRGIVNGAVSDLEKEFEGRKFTPDGHLVGSIGEVVAAYGPSVVLLDPANAHGNTSARIQVENGGPSLPCVKDGKVLWSAP
jgi:hypothetical protein